MIYLITGQPGDGKSLYTITMVKDRAEKEKREVYYHNIPDLKLPWIQLEDPLKWNACPVGSIIVIDECQTIFRPRGNGSTVPPHVAALETHRHKGYDIYLITQQPMLVDSNVRRLVGTHFHCKRKFGAPASTIHEFNQVKEQVDKNREGSIRHEFLFPKSSYALYKSAEVHTHKVRIPMRLVVLVIIPFVIGGIVWGVSHWFSKRIAAPVVSPASQQSGITTNGALPPGRKADKVLTAAEYADSFNPRIPSLAHSAPRYDGLTNAAYVPVPAGCIASSKVCKCYSQQATPLDVDDSVCRQIVAHGYFVDFEVKAATVAMAPLPNNLAVATLDGSKQGDTRRGDRSPQDGESPVPVVAAVAELPVQQVKRAPPPVPFTASGGPSTVNPVAAPVGRASGARSAPP